MKVFLSLLLSASLIVLYFLPTIISERRGKVNRNAIFALNLLAGWTFVGWVIALVWALTYSPDDVPMISKDSPKEKNDLMKTQ